MQVMVIDGRLPGMNDVVAVRGANRYAYGTFKKKWDQYISAYIYKAKLRPVDSVFISFKWVEKNKKRDLDNICGGGRKFVLDALVKTGILKNDGWGQVVGFNDFFGVDENPRVEVYLDDRSEYSPD